MLLPHATSLHLSLKATAKWANPDSRKTLILVEIAEWSCICLKKMG